MATRLAAVLHVDCPSRRYPNPRFLFYFGAYGWTAVLVYARHLEDALDEAIDWLAEHAPGHIVDEQVNEAYREGVASGLSEEEAQESAEVDTTIGGNSGHHILSWEWTVVEHPTREYLLDIQGKEPYSKHGR